MFFLLRFLFWFALVVYFLPLGLKWTDTAREELDHLQTVQEAAKGARDLATTCANNPKLCETGLRVLNAVSKNGEVVEPKRPDTPVIPVPTARPAEIRP
ncbi:MAG: hypothetical protein KF874_05620 [Rhizobiaceae bacterium]|nr:hypothetical protein [Rhizobiaceae bacterium]